MKYFSLAAFTTVLCLTSATAEDKAADLKVGPLTFKAVAPWAAKAEARPMSAGGFTRAAKDGQEAVDADFYHFGGGQGGDIASNIARWKSQFQPGKAGEAVAAEITNYKSGEQKVVVVHLKGTFLSGPPGGQKVSKEGYAMYGAIIAAPDGNVFVKFVGPEATILAAKDDFLALLSSGFAEKLAPEEKAPAAAEKKAVE